MGFMTSLGFMSNFEYNRKSAVNYDGNNRNKNNLREIDYKLSRQKGMMKRLIKQKKSLIKNMTGIDMSISDEDFFEQYVNREDEDEELGVGVEPIHELLPLVHLGRAVQSQVRVAADVDPALEHIEHLGHLREDEHAVPAALPLPPRSPSLSRHTVLPPVDRH
jgi:hypothetical protein